MDTARLLITATAEKCRSSLAHAATSRPELPAAIRLDHLRWMCNEIIREADSWPTARLQRWIGFVQAGMIANRVVDLEQLRSMFDEARNAYGERSDDPDLVDHLSPDSLYRMETGGEG